MALQGRLRVREACRACAGSAVLAARVAGHAARVRKAYGASIGTVRGTHWSEVKPP